DISDNRSVPLEQKQRELDQWRREIKACYLGQPETDLGRELAQVVQRYLVPPELFFDIISGVEMDLQPRRFPSFQDLALYCYRVASAVGLVSINIFEYRNPRTRDYAHALGMAFQLTNILRDVFYDLREYDRIYLPQDEMEAYGVTEADLRAGHLTDNLRALFKLQAHRAEHYFAKARALLPSEDRPNLEAAEIMTSVYHDLLHKLIRLGFSNPQRTVKLSRPEKIWALCRARRQSKQPAPARRPPSHIVVLGAGYAGVAAAVALSRAGHRVELLEAKAYSGGRAHSFRDAKTGLTLDNGQHIFMGCYTACLELFDQLGVLPKLDCQLGMEVPYRSAARGATSLKVGRGPAPLHLIQALWRFKELSSADRWAIAWMGIRLRIAPPPSPSRTVAAWLTESGQTPGAIRALWEPLCLAALNEPLPSASARLFHEVLRRSLFGGRRASAIYTAKVGLSELLLPEAERFLRATGGSLHLGDGAKTITFDQRRLVQITTSTGRVLEPDAVVSSLPPAALAALLPENSPLRIQITGLPTAPILGVHLFTDRPLIHEPFVGILDSPLHWLFSRPLPADAFPEPTFHTACVSSAAYAWDSLPSAELLSRLRHEIEKVIPESRGFHLRHHVIYKSRDATPAARPEVQPRRPGPTCEFENLFLAGDWTDTGLPGTLEGAVWSGFRAADHVSLRP
ncbi:MAG: hydroxysqualene dehydroxylase HpnE, partial [Verrucomicrobiia bacterium]